jgi:hypothetical protein
MKHRNLGRIVEMRHQSIPFIAAVLASSALDAPEASAKLVQWKKSMGGNDHWYEVVLVTRNLNGIEALVRASARGCGWHLATITSRAEDRFVFSLIKGDERFFREEHGPWIGAAQANANREPAGGWRWVTGERFEYTNWQSGEPNNSGGADPVLSPGTPDGQTEEFLHYKREFSHGQWVPVWNDLYHQYLLSGYIVEFDGLGCSR